MHLQNFIRMTCNAALAGGLVYVFVPDLLLHYWPALRVADVCALADPLAVMAGVGGACFSVSPLAPRFAHWWRWGCKQLHSLRRRQRTYAARLPVASPPPQPNRIRPSSATHTASGGGEMNLQQYMTMVEQAIAGAFVNNGLAIHLCGSLQGPHTLTFGLRLYQPTQPNLNKALKLASAIEAAIVDSPARVYMDKGLLYVEVPSPTPVVVKGTTLHGQGLAVPLGMTARQTIAGIDFVANPHVLLVGPTNRGKTTAARLLAYHLARQNPPRQARFIVSTFKPKDWLAFGALAHTFAVITEPRETAQMIDYLVDVMHLRTRSGQDSPHLFVFLDDLLNLLGVTEVDSQLAQLASLGRGAGIHLIVGTQRPGEKGAAGSLVTGNIPSRLVFGTADAQDAALFTGRGGSGAEKLGRYPGDALLITDGGAQRLAVGYITDNHLAGLRQHPDIWRPWLKSAGTPEPQPYSSDNVIPAVTTSEESVPVRQKRGDSGLIRAVDASADCTGTAEAKLPDRKPDTEARRYLRRLYEELGSKNQVLQQVWGGVVNDSGKTPKTKRWLDDALAEVVT